ncbi:hypothetical protein ABIA70_004357, partial [Arthrobacter sp. 754]
FRPGPEHESVRGLTHLNTHNPTAGHTNPCRPHAHRDPSTQPSGTPSTNLPIALAVPAKTRGTLLQQLHPPGSRRSNCITPPTAVVVHSGPGDTSGHQAPPPDPRRPGRHRRPRTNSLPLAAVILRTSSTAKSTNALRMSIRSWRPAPAGCTRPIRRTTGSGPVPPVSWQGRTQTAGLLANSGRPRRSLPPSRVPPAARAAPERGSRRWVPRGLRASLP